MAYFIYPPAFEATTNFSSNIIMVEGDFKDIQWANVSNPNDSRISVTMWQLNGTQFIGGSEYIIQNADPETISTPWTVNTAKNLTLSPMFYMNLFFEGDTRSFVNSHYFNISASGSTATTTSSGTRSSATRTSAITSSDTTSTFATANPATSTPTTASISRDSSGLSTGAKAGIAVGVVSAALLGLLAGWLILGRQRRMNKPQQTHVSIPTSYYEPVKMEQPSEIGGTQLSHSHELNSEAPRYELPPDSRHELPS